MSLGNHDECCHCKIFILLRVFKSNTVKAFNAIYAWYSELLFDDSLRHRPNYTIKIIYLLQTSTNRLNFIRKFCLNECNVAHVQCSNPSVWQMNCRRPSEPRTQYLEESILKSGIKWEITLTLFLLLHLTCSR